MNEFVIVTDSTADLPFSLYQEYDIKVIPMRFCVDNETREYCGDLCQTDFKAFYSDLKKGCRVTTTQINSYAYESVFTSILNSGKDILYLCFSSGLSGTYQVSKNVAGELREKFPERRIIIVDTLCASIGEGLLVYYASKMKNSGKSLDEVVSFVEENKLNVAHWFVVDDLEHLKQGGRINTLQANLGTVLNVKPIISLDYDGKLVSVSRQRGTKRALDELMKRFQKDGAEFKKQTVMVGHADNYDCAEDLAVMLRNQSLVENVVISDIGPIIGAHVGRGMIALAFMGKRDLSK